MAAQYEIGLVAGYGGDAEKIIGPFPTRDAAMSAMIQVQKMNTMFTRYRWAWARWEEIPRAEGCTVTAPEKI